MEVENFTPVRSLVGGMMIGGSVVMVLALNGKVAGISGVVARIFMRTPGDTLWRVLVGVGTLVCGGCTSGHGIYGLARGSLRSLVAVMSFMGAAIATTYVVRHVLDSAVSARGPRLPVSPISI